MSSTIRQKSQGNYERSSGGVKFGVKGVELWIRLSRSIEIEAINDSGRVHIGRSQNNMLCDTKRAKRYKPSFISSNTHKTGKATIKEQHGLSRWNAHKRSLHIYIRESITAQDIRCLQSHFKGHVTRGLHKTGSSQTNCRLPIRQFFSPQLPKTDNFEYYIILCVLTRSF
jgi:hypothetical protein